MILAAALWEGPPGAVEEHLSSTKMWRSLLGGNLFLKPNLASSPWNHCNVSSSLGKQYVNKGQTLLWH